MAAAAVLVFDIGSFSTRFGRVSSTPSPSSSWEMSTSLFPMYRSVFTPTSHRNTHLLVGNTKSFSTTTRQVFESDVVYHHGGYEHLIDYALTQLSEKEGCQDVIQGQKMIFTEAFGNPTMSRRAAFELLFETYAIDSALSVPDPHCAMTYALRTGKSSSRARSSFSGFNLHLGHGSSLVVPWIDSMPVSIRASESAAQIALASRLNIGGADLSKHFQSLVQTKYPDTKMRLEEMNTLRELLCYCADDYAHRTREICESVDGFVVARKKTNDDVSAAMKDDEKKMKKGAIGDAKDTVRGDDDAICVPLITAEQTDDAAAARCMEMGKGAVRYRVRHAEQNVEIDKTRFETESRQLEAKKRNREINAKRLRQLALEKKEQKMQAALDEVARLEDVHASLLSSGVSIKAKDQMLVENGFAFLNQFEEGLDVAKAAAKDAEEDVARYANEMKMIEEGIAAGDADAAATAAAVDVEKDATAAAAAAAAAAGTSDRTMDDVTGLYTVGSVGGIGGGGMGDTLSRRQQKDLNKERMRIIAQNAYEGKTKKQRKEHDQFEASFGMSDADWDIYSQMQGADAAAAVANVGAGDTMQPSTSPTEHAAAGTANETGIRRQLQLEDFEMIFGVERVRVPELLFQPRAIGAYDQRGLPEIVSSTIDTMRGLLQMPPAAISQFLRGDMYVTGGVASTPMIASRIASECRRYWPATDPSTDLNVHAPGTSYYDVDPSSPGSGSCWDSFKGASIIAHALSSSPVVKWDEVAITKAEYDEVGENALRKLRNPDYLNYKHILEITSALASHSL